MKVFLSWSGKPSLQAATLFKELLPCMNQELAPFLSQHDVESGARWSVRIADELDATDYGVLLLTPHNMSSAWLLFEAGALTRHLQGRACGVLLGGLTPRDVSGPLSQFQHRVFGLEGLSQLFTDLSKHCDSKLKDHQATRIAEKWWPDFESGMADIDFRGGKPKDAQPTRDDNAVLEEVLARIRGLEHSVLGRGKLAARFAAKKGSITKFGAMKATSQLLKLLNDGQASLLYDIAVAKVSDDEQSKVDEVLAGADSDDLQFLVDKGLLIKDEKKGVRINHLIGETLRELHSENKDA